MDGKKNRFWTAAACLLLLITLLGTSVPYSKATAASGTATYPIPTFVCELPVPMTAPMSAFNAVAAEPNVAGMDLVQRTHLWAAGWTGRYVGTSGTPALGPEKTFVMRYDGTKWTTMDTPNMPGANFLNGIAVRSARDAWAVGYYNYGSIDHPLAIHFDGQEWKLALYPEPAVSANTVSARFTGLTLLNAPSTIGMRVVAVGYKQFLLMPRPPEPMAMVYDGKSWSNLAVPPLPLDSRLNSITGNSLNDLWATASTYTNNEVDVTSTLWHFDGKTWKQASTDVTGTLVGVALSANKVFAVGHQALGTKTLTLAVMYDRATQEMRMLKTGDKPVNRNHLTQVTSDGQEVFAVGYAGDTSEYSLTPVVQRFDGYTFTPLNITNPRLFGKLSGAVYYNGNLWAVGDHMMDMNLRSPLALTTLCTTTDSK